MAENQYEVLLGVRLDEAKLNNIRQILSSIESQKRDIVYNVDFKLTNINKLLEVSKELDRIKDQIGNLGAAGKSKNIIPIDTKSVEKSLEKIHQSLLKLRNAFGKVDSKKGVQSLLTTVNNISKSLERVTSQFADLNRNLNNLSSRSFSLNFDFGNLHKKSEEQILNEFNMLKREAEEYEKYFAKIYSQKGTSFGSNQGAIFRLISEVDRSKATSLLGLTKTINNGGASAKTNASLREYVNLIREAAAIGKYDLSIPQSRLAADGSFVRVQNEISETERQLKELFSGGINAEGLHNSLDKISKDLEEIRASLSGVSSEAESPINRLIQSFERLSGSIDNLLANAERLKGALGTGLGTSATDTGTQRAIQSQNTLAQTSTQTADAVSQSGQRIQQAFNQLASASNLDPINLRDDISETDEMAAAVIRLKQVMSGISKLQTGQLGTAKTVQELQVLEAQLESLSAEWNETVAEINRGGGLSLPQMQQLRGQMEATARTIEQLKAKLVGGIQSNFGNYGAQIAALEARFDRLATKPEEVRAGLESLKQALSALKNADSTAEIISANNKYLEILKQVNAQLNLNAAAERQANDTVALEQSKNNLALKMRNWLRDNSAAAKQFGGEISELQMRLQNCGNITGVRQVARDFENVAMRAKEAGLASLSFVDRLKNQWQQYSTYLSVSSLIMYAFQGLRDMFEQVKAIDSAMTELKKVTNETDESYNRFLSNAAQRSKEIGTTIDGLVSSTADFARLGYGFEDAQGLAEVANIYAVVGDEIEGVEGATESLISTMAAFKDEMNGMSDSDFAMSIIDKMNEVGKLIA